MRTYDFEECPFSVAGMIPGKITLHVEADDPCIGAWIDLDPDEDDNSESERFLTTFWYIFDEGGTLTIFASGTTYKVEMVNQTWRPILDDEAAGNLADFVDAYRKYEEEELRRYENEFPQETSQG